MATQTYSWPEPTSSPKQGYPATREQTQKDPWRSPAAASKSQSYYWPEPAASNKQSYPDNDGRSDTEGMDSAIALSEANARSQYKQGYPAKDSMGGHASGGNFDYAMGLAHRSEGSQGSTYPESLSKPPTEPHVEAAMSLASAICKRQSGKGFGPK